MKRSVWSVIICVVIFSSCTKSITGEGPVVTETRTTAAFTGVQLEGSGDVEVLQGAVTSVAVTGYANLVPIYTTSVHNGILVLKFDNEYKNIRRNNIKTKIFVADITKVQIHGSGNILVNGFLNSNNLTAAINGSGKIDITNSTYAKVSAEINGSGDIRAITAPATEVDAEINGSGYIAVTCSQKLKATISGSGNVDYWGNPAVDADISGSGKVRKQ
jgi:hypothetical protein